MGTKSTSEENCTAHGQDQRLEVSAEERIQTINDSDV